MHFPVKLLCNFFTPVLLIFFIKHYAVSLVTTFASSVESFVGRGGACQNCLKMENTFSKNYCRFIFMLFLFFRMRV